MINGDSHASSVTERPFDDNGLARRPPTLADRVTATRHQRFVGRAAELALFRDALALADPPFAVLFVHGPGGIGKTTLLGEYRHMAEADHRPVIAIDGHACDPTPPGVLAAIARELQLDDPRHVPGHLAQLDRFVLLVDTCEVLASLDGWFRNDLLPRLPATTLTVFSGRTSADAAWRASPGWTDLVEVLPLRNLDATESHDYLARRGVPDDAHASALAFTHGHPLALSLVGDVAIRGATPFQPDAHPDVVTSLLHHFVEQVPSTLHRDALELCAIARVTTETLLARIADEDEARALFAWLCSLSFIEHDRNGVFPHDLARDVLVADARWRHPDHYVELHRKVHDHVIGRVRATHGPEQFQELYTLMYLHRNNPTWQQMAPLDQYGRDYLDIATPADAPVILDIVQHHEGVRSAEIADHWLQIQPENFLLFRDVHAEINGIFFRLDLRDLEPDDVSFDPVTASILAMIDRHGPIRAGEDAVCARYCMGRDSYRTPGLRLQFAMIGAAYVYTHARVAWMVMPIVDPEYWMPMLQYLHCPHYPDADMKIDGRTWAVFGHDWRLEPIEVLDQVLVQRELTLSARLEPGPPMSPPAPVLLSEEAFRRAVRQALRDFHRSDALARNPLCRCRLVTRCEGHDPVETLRGLLRDAAEQLGAGDRTRRWRDAIHHTWIAPERSQEAAAERLDIPFSTYRRYLATGVDRVAAELWHRELATSALQRG
jgi:hypothetical protein